MNRIPDVTAGRASIPALGLGTWPLSGERARSAVRSALALGYRHVDTAAMYGNEAEVGAAVAASGVDRDEVFLVTKVPGPDLDRQGVRRTVSASLRALDTHIDLLLAHWPNPEVPVGETLEAMREFQEGGAVRHLGVSNFGVDLLDEAREHAEIVTNQVPLNPFRRDDELLAYAEREGVAVTAYSPLGKGRVSRDPTLGAIAEARGCTPAQVALRWLLDQPRVVAIPKAADPAHQRENLAALDVELADEDRARIGALA